MRILEASVVERSRAIDDRAHAAIGSHRSRTSPNMFPPRPKPWISSGSCQPETFQETSLDRTTAARRTRKPSHLPLVLGAQRLPAGETSPLYRVTMGGSGPTSRPEALLGTKISAGTIRPRSGFRA